MIQAYCMIKIYVQKNKTNPMSRLLFLVYVLCLSPAMQAQDGAWEKWDPAIIERANTAAEFEYYSAEEKKVLTIMNLARIDGKLFSETILPGYVEQNGLQNNSYVKSLYRDLKKTKDLVPLVPEKDLTSIAQGHAKNSGESGHIGHKDFKKRFEPFMGNPYTGVGENCSYGYATAVDIVITLLIDDGVKDVGHRVNILNPEFNSAGVAIRPHKGYRYNCVIDFGKKDRSGLNDTPF